MAGWLAAIAILLQGWLPILLQASPITGQTGGHDHGQYASTSAAAAPGATSSGKSQGCPLFHSAICLCAAFVKLLPAPDMAAPFAPPLVRGARGRFPAQRPPRRRRAVAFDARGPPVSG